MSFDQFLPKRLGLCPFAILIDTFAAWSMYVTASCVCPIHHVQRLPKWEVSQIFPSTSSPLTWWIRVLRCLASWNTLCLLSLMLPLWTVRVFLAWFETIESVFTTAETRLACKYSRISSLPLAARRDERQLYSQAKIRLFFFEFARRYGCNKVNLAIQQQQIESNQLYLEINKPKNGSVQKCTCLYNNNKLRKCKKNRSQKMDNEETWAPEFLKLLACFSASSMSKTIST